MRNVGFALALVVLLMGGWFLFGGEQPLIDDFALTTNKTALTAAAIQTVPAPPLGPTYTNTQFGFSVQRPETYTVQEFKEEDSTSILIQDTSGHGIQIFVQPFPEDLRSLTAERVREDIPDMQVVDAQVVEVGDAHTGVAFLSDNEAFGGASREVWFVFRGHLYQISTYARLDPLLQSMFGTWQFK